jgi:signal transduction histidine kinase
MDNKPSRILLIEDNPGDAQLLRAVLSEIQGIPFALEWADRLSKGLERLADRGIEAILLDLGLPDSQGLETFVKVQAEAPDLPIIILSGLDDEATAIEAVRRGAEDYLVKGHLAGKQIARSVRYAVERRKLEEQLRQARKMEAIGHLAGGIAHDFNNIITTIMGYAEMGLTRPGLSEPLRRCFEAVQIGAERAARLTRQLLAFSRRQTLQPKVINLNDILLNMDEMLHRLIGEHVQLVARLAGDLKTVRVDPGQHEQIIINLAVNARDAMPEGGRLIFETANVHLNGESDRSDLGLSPGEYVMLAVTDTGCGMTDEVKARLFEPFFTTKEVGKATGLGLATCYGIVRQGGGAISVESELGRGTTFTIYLPQSPGEPAILARRDVTDSLPRGSETILLVEDDPSVRMLVKDILSEQGYRVLEAANGEEALHLVKSRVVETIDLLLTDVVMPRMGGKVLADRLKVIHPGLKVLFASGYTDNTPMDETSPFLQKPFTVGDLACKVREVLDLPCEAVGLIQNSQVGSALTFPEALTARAAG